MDGLSRAVDEVLLSNLECPVCKDYMVPPIKLCTNGHTTCSNCSKRVQCCPTCRSEFSEIRCLTLENIVRSHKYPCANRQSGCLDLLSIEHIAKHRAGCVYGKIKCPLHLLKMCSWKGMKSDMENHVQREHLLSFTNTSTLSSDLSQDMSVKVLLCFGELFVYHQRKKYSTMNCAVQLIGTSSEASKYKCEFTLRAVDGIEQISNTFLVRSYEEDWETSFNSRKCFCVDSELARDFLVGNKHKLTITLSTVE